MLAPDAELAFEQVGGDEPRVGLAQRADGVTTERKGVSKLVSVELR